MANAVQVLTRSLSSMQHPQSRRVLLSHVQEDQGVLWQAILNSQGVIVDFDLSWRRHHPNLLSYLQELTEQAQPLPNLLIMDINAKIGEESHAAEVCRWCTKYLTDLQVIFLYNSGEQVPDLAKRWGLRRGAVDVLPKLTRENLLVLAIKLTSILGLTIKAEPLKGIAELMPSSVVTPPVLPETQTPIPNLAEPASSLESRVESKADPKPESKNELKPKADSQEYIIYRGVKVPKRRS
ncbi:MAG: hypothetical protein SFT94_08755 [Pseudanabaenaceae cyanobacterium bins.68]|nr:hypothetical protein [Pseudanabaenaceae cyanobacterium bins.68]